MPRIMVTTKKPSRWEPLSVKVRLSLSAAGRRALSMKFFALTPSNEIDSSSDVSFRFVRRGGEVRQGKMI